MAELLKNSYDQAYIKQLIAGFSKQDKQFDGDTFYHQVFDNTWQDRELKSRMHHIAQVLHRVLPSDYLAALRILKPVCEQPGRIARNRRHCQYARTGADQHTEYDWRRTTGENETSRHSD